MEEVLHQTVDPSSYYGKVQEFCHQQEPLFKVFTGIYHATETLNQPVQLRW